MLDANKDAIHGSVARMFRDLQMVNLHFRNTSDIREHPPLPTCWRSAPIDAIFGTPGIRPVQRGYTAPGSHLSTDHSIMWVDIHLPDVLGTPLLAHLPFSSPKRLSCQDPWVIQRYNDSLKQFLRDHLPESLPASTRGSSYPNERMTTSLRFT